MKTPPLPKPVIKTPKAGCCWQWDDTQSRGRQLFYGNEFEDSRIYLIDACECCGGVFATDGYNTAANIAMDLLADLLNTKWPDGPPTDE